MKRLAILNGQLDYTADPAATDPPATLPWAIRVTVVALAEVIRLHRLWANVEAGGRRAYLRGAYLRGADLQGAYLRGADLRGADLQGADLQGADLQGADLRGAYLRGAYLRGADLQGADLRGADLQGAYLRGAYLRGADLRGAYLRGADLQGADLRGADLPSPTVVLLAAWGTLTPALTVELMRYDASCHPDPARFDEWATTSTGRCPYDDVNVERAAQFTEDRDLWREHGNGPCPRPHDLMVQVLAEKCPEWTEEQLAAFDAGFATHRDAAPIVDTPDDEVEF